MDLSFDDIGIIVSLNDQYTGVVVERLQREEGGK